MHYFNEDLVQITRCGVAIADLFYPHHHFLETHVRSAELSSRMSRRLPGCCVKSPFGGLVEGFSSSRVPSGYAVTTEAVGDVDLLVKSSNDEYKDSRTMIMIRSEFATRASDTLIQQLLLSLLNKANKQVREIQASELAAKFGKKLLSKESNKSWITASWKMRRRTKYSRRTRSISATTFLLV